MTKALVMIGTYSLMTPLGIGIGIGIAHSYDAGSVTALAAQAAELNQRLYLGRGDYWRQRIELTLTNASGSAARHIVSNSE